MPIPVTTAVEEMSSQAETKAAQVRDLPRYMWSSALAGAFVGVAVVLLLSVAAPLVAAGSPMSKLVQGSVFGVALTLVVFAGAELFTGNAMVMLQGLLTGKVSVGELLAVWMASLVGNLAGSIGFAALVYGGGTLATGPTTKLIASVIKSKSLLTGPQLFWRSVLCNMLVCLAMWMAARTRSDAAKLVVLWWALLAFVASGFEHSVANMTVFALGALQGTSTWMDLAKNLVWTVPGNIVGGGLVIGLGYAWLARVSPTMGQGVVGAESEVPHPAAA
jgi:nitrite transporter